MPFQHTLHPTGNGGRQWLGGAQKVPLPFQRENRRRRTSQVPFEKLSIFITISLLKKKLAIHRPLLHLVLFIDHESHHPQTVIPYSLEIVIFVFLKLFLLTFF